MPPIDYPLNLLKVLGLDTKSDPELDSIAKSWLEERLGEPLNKATKTKNPPAPGNLLVHHNLTAENLQHASSIGGLAAPSLAISHKDHPMGNFGEITLVAHPDLVDPKKGTPVFDADIYSPRHPRTEYKAKPKEFKEFSKWIAPYSKKISTGGDDFESKFKSDGPEDLPHNRGTKWPLALAFLEEKKGHKLEAPTRNKRLHYSWASSPALQDFVNKNKDIYSEEPDSQYWKGFSEAAKAAINTYHINDAADPEHERDIRDAQTIHIIDPETGLVNTGYSWRLSQDINNANQTEPDQHRLQDMVDEAIKPHEEEFQKWASSILHPLVHSTYIKKVNPETGNIKRVPYTIDNLLKEMTKKVKQGESFNYGLVTARAAGAKKFKDLEQIKGAQSQLVPKDFFDAKKKENDERFGNLVEAIRHHHVDPEGFRVHDSLAEAIGESYKRGKWLGNELEQSGFKGVPGHLRQQVGQFATDLLKMPTEYFEAKPQRVVNLQEFHGAAVPSDTRPEVLETLKRYGLDIEPYDRNNESDRVAAVNRVAQRNNLFLSEQDLEEPLRKSIGFITYPKLGEPQVPTKPYVTSRETANTRRQSQGAAPLEPSNRGVTSYNVKNLSPVKHQKMTALVVNQPTPKSTEAVVHHEAQHTVFARLAQRFGDNTRREIIEHTLAGLTPEEHGDLSWFWSGCPGQKYQPKRQHEEKLAYLGQYLQDSKVRHDIHTNLGISGDKAETQAFQGKLRKIWDKLRVRAQDVEPEHVGIKKNEDISNAIDQLGLGAQLDQLLSSAQWLDPMIDSGCDLRKNLDEDYDLETNVLMSIGEPLQKSKKDALQMYKPESPGAPSSKEHTDWAYSKMPNENWSLWTVRHHREKPEDFTPAVKRKIEHFAGSQHIPEVANVRFDKTHNLHSGLATLEQAEKQYIDRSKNNLKLAPKPKTATKIMEFGDGYSWWNLGKGSCSKEGEAMGHCGNVPSEKKGDEVLSLRKEHKLGGKKYYEPHLTFIKNGNEIGEMKGRGNMKPAPHYHEKIASLFETGLVPVGGGYLPENNFGLKDLPEERYQQAALKNPSLRFFRDGDVSPEVVGHLLGKGNGFAERLKDIQNIPTEVQKLILEKGNNNERDEMTAHPSLDPAIQDAVALDDTKLNADVLARNPSLTDNAYNKLKTMFPDDGAMLRTISRNTKSEAHQLELAREGRNAEALTENKNLTPKAQMALANWGVYSVNRGLANHSNLHPDVARKLAEGIGSASSIVEVDLASNTNTPVDVQEKLLKYIRLSFEIPSGHTHTHIAAGLAQNPNLAPHIAEELTKHMDEGVRRHIATNRGLKSVSIQKKLINDGSQQVRFATAANPNFDPSLYDTALGDLSMGAGAGGLASQKHLPPDIQNKLFDHSSGAGTSLRRYSNMTPELFIKAAGNGEMAQDISQNKFLPPDVQLLLTKPPDPEVGLTHAKRHIYELLARNPALTNQARRNIEKQLQGEQ
jgi:hypothetical protein